MKKHEILILLILAIISISYGLKAHIPASITPDTAMHAEITDIIKEQIYITSWEPYANNAYTYPPLFHYLAAMLPGETINAVIILGVLSSVLFTAAIYLLTRTYSQKAAIPAAIIATFLPAINIVQFYGEFPQLLTMALIVLQIYFFKEKKYLLGSIITGLSVLGHIFFSLIAITIHIWHLPKVKKKLAYIAIPALISIPWIPQYITVVKLAWAGTWENSRYNLIQPVFAFWKWKQIKSFLFGKTSFGPILVALALYGSFRIKDWFMRLFLWLSIMFSIFHLPFTQLKVLDMLSIPVSVLAGVGFSKLTKKKVLTGVLGIILVVHLVMIYSATFEKTQTDWKYAENSPDKNLIKAAEWLKQYDKEKVRIYSYNAETWTARLSNKLPLDAFVTHLEKYSDENKKQLALKEYIKNNLDEKSLEKKIKGKVKYVLVPTWVKTKLSHLVYENEEWRIYQTT